MWCFICQVTLQESGPTRHWNWLLFSEESHILRGKSVTAVLSHQHHFLFEVRNAVFSRIFDRKFQRLRWRPIWDIKQCSFPHFTAILLKWINFWKSFRLQFAAAVGGGGWSDQPSADDIPRNSRLRARRSRDSPRGERYSSHVLWVSLSCTANLSKLSHFFRRVDWRWICGFCENYSDISKGKFQFLSRQKRVFCCFSKVPVERDVTEHRDDDLLRCVAGDRARQRLQTAAAGVHGVRVREDFSEWREEPWRGRGGETKSQSFSRSVWKQREGINSSSHCTSSPEIFARQTQAKHWTVENRAFVCGFSAVWLSHCSLDKFFLLYDSFCWKVESNKAHLCFGPNWRKCSKLTPLAVVHKNLQHTRIHVVQKTSAFLWVYLWIFFFFQQKGWIPSQYVLWRPQLRRAQIHSLLVEAPWTKLAHFFPPQNLVERCDAQPVRHPLEARKCTERKYRAWRFRRTQQGILAKCCRLVLLGETRWAVY